MLTRRTRCLDNNDNRKLNLERKSQRRKNGFLIFAQYGNSNEISNILLCKLKCTSKQFDVTNYDDECSILYYYKYLQVCSHIANMKSLWVSLIILLLL